MKRKIFLFLINELFQNLKIPCQAFNFTVLVAQKWELRLLGKEKKKENIFPYDGEPLK